MVIEARGKYIILRREFLSGFGKLSCSCYIEGKTGTLKIAYCGGKAMLSEQEEASVCALFDSYCHTILRNAIRNHMKHMSVQEKYEFLAEYPETYVKKSCARRDEYEGDHLYVAYKNRSYQLDNEILLQAMQSLQERELGVLILGFWLEWTDLKIAKRPVSSI